MFEHAIRKYWPCSEKIFTMEMGKILQKKATEAKMIETVNVSRHCISCISGPPKLDVGMGPNNPGWVLSGTGEAGGR